MEYVLATAKDQALKLINFNELAESIKQEMTKYDNLVYTDENIKEAKDDRKFLKDFVEELNNKKIAIRKEFYDPFEDQVKELKAIVQERIDVIDAAVKDYEAREKGAKIEACKEAYNSIFADLQEITFDQLYRKQWENKSFTMKAVEDELKAKHLNIENDLVYIDRLEKNKRLSVRFDYLASLNLADALAKNEVRQEYIRRQEAKAPAKPSTDKYMITIRVNVTDEELDSILDFINKNGIELIL